MDEGMRTKGRTVFHNVKSGRPDQISNRFLIKRNYQYHPPCLQAPTRNAYVFVIVRGDSDELVEGHFERWV